MSVVALFAAEVGGPERLPREVRFADDVAVGEGDVQAREAVRAQRFVQVVEPHEELAAVAARADLQDAQGRVRALQARSEVRVQVVGHVRASASVLPCSTSHSLGKCPRERASSHASP